MFKKILTILILATLSIPFSVKAQDAFGNTVSFNIQESFDFEKRSELSAFLLKTSNTAYWYIDSDWWTNISIEEREKAAEAIDSLSVEFESNIYPVLTENYGSEWSPGIDGDTKITMLFHSMGKNNGGYSNTADEYPKIQLPKSNEREMVYLNSDFLGTENMKVFLAHEFVHLITFNQKDKIFGVAEDIWLNEARADYSSTLLGYDNNPESNNIKNRISDFLTNPSDSLTEWRDTRADYGVTNLFTQYLVDHYGFNILSESLRTNKTGIESLNEILKTKDFSEDFEQIFEDWVITLLINDCNISEKYCYFNENLKNFKVTPLINFMPLSGESSLSVTNSIKDWSGNWSKFIGGDGTLEVSFNWINTIANNEIKYITQYANGEMTLGTLFLQGTQSGKITVPEFGSDVISLIIMPMAKIKTTKFSGIEPLRTFYWLAKTIKSKEPSNPQIEIPSVVSLSRPVMQMGDAEKNVVISQLEGFLNSLNSGCTITEDLYLGMNDNSEVRCLQQFLKAQGEEIYPEGFVTGNFYTLTEQAVKRFQEKYANDVLTPWGLTKGSGYVGSTTRNKINGMNNLTELGSVTIPNVLSLSKPISQMSNTELNSLIEELEGFISNLKNSLTICTITEDLYLGMVDNSEVRCLQQFLKAQGEEIYPEGFVTGNFYTLTEQAVKRFQEKYANDVLTPWGLTKGSGYVGSTTRNKINELISK